MKKTRSIFCALTALAAAVFVTGCMSLQQDIIASSSQQVESGQMGLLEQRIAVLDAQSFMEPAVDRTEACDALFKELDAALADSGMQKAQQARLLALYGRVQLLAGKKAAAKDSYAASLAASKGDPQTLVLGHRLGEGMSLADGEQIVSGADEKALLVLERALTHYAAGNYVQAVAAFDSAFIALDAFYQEAYKAVRTRAWDLRALPKAESVSSSLVALLQKPQITVSEMASIAQSNSQLLYPFLAGKTYTEAELYRRLAPSGVFTAAGSDASGKTPVAEAAVVVTRLLSARFLWNLYVAKKGISAVVYSAVYKGSALPSPVPDVESANPDFDAALGCVEHEIMSLVDGVHFEPEAAVTAVEFNNWLLNIK